MTLLSTILFTCNPGATNKMIETHFRSKYWSKEKRRKEKWRQTTTKRKPGGTKTIKSVLPSPDGL